MAEDTDSNGDSTASPAWEPGAVVGERFKLDKQVGEGGSVVVWRGWDRLCGEWVALKRPHPTQRATHVHFAFEHRREVLVTLAGHDLPSALPTVVAVPDTVPYLAVEHVPGASLAERPPSTVKERRRALQTVAAVCEWLHDRGRVHCDLRPENVCRTAADDLRVVDFGSVRQRGRCPQCDAPLTPTWLEFEQCENCSARVPYRDPSNREFVVDYRAPELDAQTRLVGPWTDVYSLARFADAIAADGSQSARSPTGPRAELAPLSPTDRPPTPAQLLAILNERGLW